MTTIVCNRQGMAADRKIVAAVNFRSTKILRLNGSLIATAGDVALGNRFIAFKKGWPTATPPTEQNDDFKAVELTKDGRIFYYEWDFEPLEVDEDFYAVGSGAQYAIAAMACGFPMAESIMLASQYDEMTGEDVDVFYLEV